MSLRRVLALALASLAFAPVVASAKGEKIEDDADEADAAAEPAESASDEEPDPEDEPVKKPATAKPGPQGDFVKQDLSGHDLGTNKKQTDSEKDRFFVDKVDTKKSAKSTLIQGSLASSSFLFTESGGAYGTNLGDNSAKFSRMFTELRLQTDFRHIMGGKWDARVDARARLVNTPDDGSIYSSDPTRLQSGFNGRNEYDIRELWLFRSGKRSDIFFGRQFVADLGAIKFDGLRIDYASSQTFTLIGFGGLYPVRGSRSIDTDYTPLKTNDLATAGRFVGTGGFGAAYRTASMYGSFGGVTLVPLAGESPRVFATSSGYLRSGATLDVYHFVLVDLLSSAGAGLTNVSAGLNYKPIPRLRLTGNFNRVDVDTLNVQANAFLNPQDGSNAGIMVLQNETFFRRLSTNVGRVGLSAGLGQMQRFELSTQFAYRYRPGVTLSNPDGSASVALEATQGVDIYASLTDRRSFKDLRIGIDASQSFPVTKIGFERSQVFSVRGFLARELSSGNGEWEGEVSYAKTKDTVSGTDCSVINSCFGSSVGAIFSLGGNLYYRLNRDWYTIGSLFLSRQTLTQSGGPTPGADPAVLGLMGYFRIAYRF